jgi:hypothetical protein
MTASNDYHSRSRRSAPPGADELQPKTAGSLPIRACIRLEGFSQAARTSSIDAEWESLSVAAMQESSVQTVLPRPRFETLPGLGTGGQPAAHAYETEWTATLDGERSLSSTPECSAPLPPLTPKLRRSRRAPVLSSILAATLCLAVVAVLAWRSRPDIFAPRSLESSVQSNLAAELSQPSPPPTLLPAQPLPSARVLVAETTPATSKAEPPLPKPGKALPHSTLAAARPSAKSPAPRLAVASSYRAHKGNLVATDNPY